MLDGVDVVFTNKESHPETYQCALELGELVKKYGTESAVGCMATCVAQYFTAHNLGKHHMMEMMGAVYDRQLELKHERAALKRVRRHEI